MKTHQYFVKSLMVFSLIFFSLISCENSKSFKNTDELFKAMKIKNDSLWFQNYTFKQKTVFFDKNQVKTDSATWYEAVSYPSFFRIDRDTVKGNYTIYRNDSTYHILSDTLYRASNDPAKHLLIKGGLYYMSFDKAINKLKNYGYDISIFRKDMFHNEPVYVIGNNKNQIWLHANNYYCMRRISTSEKGSKTDVIYDNFKPLGKGWVEQKVTFYYDGKKRMEEYYFDIKIREYINPETFNLKNKYKWYLKY